MLLLLMQALYCIFTTCVFTLHGHKGNKHNLILWSFDRAKLKNDVISQKIAKRIAGFNHHLYTGFRRYLM